MEPRCTCGAYLPADARFCHKCGKPQFEEDIQRMREQEAAPPPPAQRPPLPPDVETRPAPSAALKKYRALVITLLMALGIMIAGAISPFLVFPALPAAGFLAAVLYSKQTRAPLSAAAGGFVGWLTGLWVFLPSAIMLTTPTGAKAISQIQSSPQFAQIMPQDPRELIALVVFSSFCMLTILPGIGGMLGASLAGKGRQAS